MVHLTTWKDIETYWSASCKSKYLYDITVHKHTHTHTNPSYFYLLFLTYSSHNHCNFLRVGWGYSSELEHLPNMHRALGSILNTGLVGFLRVLQSSGSKVCLSRLLPSFHLLLFLPKAGHRN